MTQALEFSATTRHLGLPMLFAGQSQKEFFVNQALTVIDALWPHSVLGSLSAPPAAPQDGDCYRIAAPAQGAWAGKEDQLAVHIGGAWHLITPPMGAMVFDRGAGQYLHFNGTWQSASLPAAATAGAVIDAEARALLAQVIDALAKLGLVARHPD